MKTAQFNSIISKFEVDWGEHIVAIVKKKDLDGYEFADCWKEDFDWTELDLYVIESFREELIGYAEVDYETRKIKGWNTKKFDEDLTKYENHLRGKKNEK